MNGGEKCTDKTCPYKPKKVLTQKQAEKEPVGSYYHPTENRYRTGVCSKGYVLKESFDRKEYFKKNGTFINRVHIGPTCIKNIGKPGKLLNKYKMIKINEKNSFEPFYYTTKDNNNKRHESLLNAIKKLSYSTVIHKLSSLRTFKKNSDTNIDINLYKKYDTDIKKLQEWRKENPELYKKVKNSKILNNEVINNTILSNKVLNVKILNNEVFNNETSNNEVFNNEVSNNEVFNNEVSNNEVLNNKNLNNKNLNNKNLNNKNFNNEVSNNEVLNNKNLNNKIFNNEVSNNEVSNNEVSNNEVLNNKKLNKKNLNNKSLENKILNNEISNNKVLNNKIKKLNKQLEVLTNKINNIKNI